MATMRKDFRVAGTTFDNRQKYLGYLKSQGKPFKTALVREPNNPYDKNAILIMAHTQDNKRMPLGYVPRELAETLAPIIDAGRYIYINKVQIVGGGRGYNYGVTINIGWYTESRTTPARNRRKAISE